MTPIIIDPSLYCEFEDDQLVGINGSYVGDLLREGTDDLRTYSDTTLEQSEITGNQQAPTILTRMDITESDNMSHIDQDFCMNKIEQIPSYVEFTKFVSVKMKITWLTNIRPEIVFEITQIVQLTRAMYAKDIDQYYKRLNISIKYVNEHKASIRAT